MTFKSQMEDDLAFVFYNTGEFAETVDIESADGDDAYTDIPVLFDFSDGPEYQGADTPGIEGTARMKVGDIEEIKTGYIIYRGNNERWRMLGNAVKSTDGLEWTVPISKYSE